MPSRKVSAVTRGKRHFIIEYNNAATETSNFFFKKNKKKQKTVDCEIQK